MFRTRSAPQPITYPNALRVALSQQRVEKAKAQDILGKVGSNPQDGQGIVLRELPEIGANVIRAYQALLVTKRVGATTNCGSGAGSCDDCGGCTSELRDIENLA